MNKTAALTLLAAKAALGASLALGFATSPAVPAHPHEVTASPAFVACEEDQPCWNPCTMGDHHGYDAQGVWFDCRVWVNADGSSDWHLYR